MNDNAYKTPFQAAMNAWNNRNKESDLQYDCQALPCTVSQVMSSGLVEVNFEVNEPTITFPKVQVPVAYPEYIRYPIQVGDKGVTVPADVWLGNITGTGAATPPDLTKAANLGALSFIWLGNKNWTAPDDTQAVVVYGPNGVILRDTNKTTVFTLTPDGITITLGGNLTINTNGNDIVINGGGNITVNGGGDVVAGTISLMNHTHSAGSLSPPSGETGPPQG